MQCFFQLFDDKGAAQLEGSSKFKDHIDWLPLLAWNAPTTGASDASTSLLGGKGVHIVLLSDTDAPAARTLAKAAADGRRWSKGTLDCLKDGEDPAWYLRLTLQGSILVTSFLEGDGATEATMWASRSSIDYRDAASKVTYFAGAPGARVSRDTGLHPGAPPLGRSAQHGAARTATRCCSRRVF
jgi:type VI protein secretion system component Hcp